MRQYTSITYSDTCVHVLVVHVMMMMESRRSIESFKHSAKDESSRAVPRASVIHKSHVEQT